MTPATTLEALRSLGPGPHARAAIRRALAPAHRGPLADDLAELQTRGLVAQVDGGWVAVDAAPLQGVRAPVSALLLDLLRLAPPQGYTLDQCADRLHRQRSTVQGALASLGDRVTRRRVGNRLYLTLSTAPEAPDLQPTPGAVDPSPAAPAPPPEDPAASTPPGGPSDVEPVAAALGGYDGTYIVRASERPRVLHVSQLGVAGAILASQECERLTAELAAVTARAERAEEDERARRGELAAAERRVALLLATVADREAAPTALLERDAAVARAELAEARVRELEARLASDTPDPRDHAADVAAAVRRERDRAVTHARATASEWDGAASARPGSEAAGRRRLVRDALHKLADGIAAGHHLRHLPKEP